MNKVFIAFFLSIYFNSFAQFNVTNPQDGVYGGVESGIVRVFVKGEFRNQKSSLSETEFLNKDFTKSVIGINLGYGKYFGIYLLGLEAHYSLYTRKISENYIQENFNFEVSIASKSELDLIIGRKIGAKSLLTLRGGIALSNIDITAISNLRSNSIVLDDEWIGYSVGMGYVYGINDNMAIKTKYNLSTFKNNKFSETSAQLVDNRFTLSMIYSLWRE